MTLTTTPATAAGIYGAVGRLALGGAASAEAGSPAGQPTSFADLLGTQVQAVIDQGRATEARQRDLLAGRGDVVDVVTAVSETEVALQTMVAVRDRVIAAYEEIMRMPI